MRAWLPSRRSTLHHRGALVRRWSGQVRSDRSTGTVATYLAYAIGLGCWLSFTWFPFHTSTRNKNPPPKAGVGASGGSPLAKQQVVLAGSHCIIVLRTARKSR